jgi:ADP-ribose pyrophosphatase YjhB (NUDIX family)
MHKLQTEILKALEQRSRTYSEIYKSLSIRSNLFNYHLSKLISTKLVTKEDDRYYLTTEGESKAPYLDINSEDQPILAVVLKINYNGGRVLVKRKKEAFFGYFAMPGGKIQKNEDIEDAVKRILKKETGLDCVSSKHIATVQETVVENTLDKHHFILLLHDVDAIGNLTNGKTYSELPLKIVPSDVEMMKLTRENFATSVITSNNGELQQTHFSAH